MNKKVVGYSLLAVACVAACALAIVSRPSNEVSVEYLSERTPVE